MNEFWTESKMGDVLSIKHGFAFKGEYFSSRGKYILLTPGNFYEKGGFKYTPGKEKYYFGSFPNEYICSKGDLVLAMTEQSEGLLGSTAIVPIDNVYLHNQRIGLVTIDEAKVDKYYLYYLFGTESVRQQIKGSASGTKVKHTSPERIYDIKIMLPPLSHQRRVGRILYDLDHKIELNNTMVSTLEGAAKLIYRYWFVQFDFPDEDGNPYKSSGGEMTYNDKVRHQIPKNWTVQRLEELTSIYLGGTPATNNQLFWQNGTIPWLNSSEVANFPVVSSELKITEDAVSSSAAKVMKAGTVLLSIVRYIRPTILGIAAAANQSVVGVEETSELKKSFLYGYLCSQISRYMAQRTGAQQPHINKEAVSISYVVMPNDNSILAQYYQTAEPLFELIINKAKENHALDELRKWLLPLLMNGQIIVKTKEAANLTVTSILEQVETAPIATVE